MSKYLIITGGSRGIGEKTIECFRKSGWKAVNISRSPSVFPDVKNIQIDLSLPETIHQNSKDLLDAVKDATQVALVHNAAYYKPDALPTLSLADLHLSWQVNVVASIILNQYLLPKMPAGSAIIYVGSTLAEKAVPGSASYVISKHALVGLMKATCQDLIDKKIHTCCVCPGLVDTKLLKDTINKATVDFLLENKVIGKRLIQPEEIAKVIYFCATTDVINGITLHANLGQVAE